MNIDFQTPSKEAFQSRRRSSSTRVVERLGTTAALWLIAVPQWTDQLAIHLHFPIDTDLTFSQFLDREVAHGVIERRVNVDKIGRTLSTFWVTPELRQHLVDELRNGDLELYEQVQIVAAAIADTSDVPVPAITSLWAELVTVGVGIYEAGAQDVVKRARDLVECDKITDAAALVTAAEAIVPFGGPPYATALARARRLVHLGYRRRRDRQHLDRFVRRHEQITRLRAFVEGDPDAWALHLLGMGGVGKTMLIRYLASGLFSDEQGLARFPVTRVDFDNVNPDYPTRRPVQLLLEIADELEPYADTRAADRALRTFYSYAESTHSAAASGELSDYWIVDETIIRFAEFLNQLPSPVLLVLDTCEELAKLRPTTGEAPAVQRTFDILERVHRGCPTVKVLLAGRRYLAREGRGWQVEEGLELQSLASLASRKYLDLAILEGFTEDEARIYLTGSDVICQPTTEQVETFLELAVELPPKGKRRKRRYNPFDLALYRSWWEDDPGLDPTDLRAAGSDAYIEGRIVNRLRDAELEKLLPVVALFGRFDATMLQPLCGKWQAEDAFARLAEQEWAETRLDYDTGKSLLVIDDLLRQRLLKWAAAAPQRQSDLDHICNMLAGPLAERLLEDDLGAVTVDQVVAALRFARTNEAASLWVKLENRIGIDRRWDWAANVLDRVRGELVERFDKEPIFEAAVSATTIAVECRRLSIENYEADWRQVLEVATTHGSPEDSVCLSLAERARLALLAIDKTADADAVRRLLARLPHCVTADAASIIAAAEAVLARVPPANWKVLRLKTIDTFIDTFDENVLVQWANTVEAQIGAAALVVAMAVAIGDAHAILRAEARRLATKAADQITRTWADWPMQDSRDPRVWAALHEAAATRSPIANETLDEWEKLALMRIEDINNERLLSFVVELRGAAAPLAISLIDSLVLHDRYIPKRLPSTAVHDAVPPLFVTLASAYYKAGMPTRAEETLLERLIAARDSRIEDSTVRACEEAMVWLAVRLRRPRYRSSMVKRMIADSSRPRAQLLAIALKFLADDDGRLNAEGHLAQSISYEDPALMTILLELAAALKPGPTEELRSLSRQLRHHDPITSWQLWIVALQAETHSKKESNSVDITELEYRYRAARMVAADLPEPPVAARTNHDGPWEQWLIRHDTVIKPKFEQSTGLARLPHNPTDLVRLPRSYRNTRRYHQWRRHVVSTLAVCSTLALAGIVPIISLFSGANVTWLTLLPLAILSLFPIVLPRAFEATMVRGARLFVMDANVRILDTTRRIVTARIRLTGPSSIAPILRALAKVSPSAITALRRPQTVDLNGSELIAKPVVAASSLHEGFLEARLHLHNPADAQLDWESALTEITANARSWRVVWTRQAPVRLQFTQRHWHWTEGGVALWAPAEWTDLFDRSYGSLLGPRVKGSPRVTIRAGGPAPRLAHLLGSPVATDYGMVLQIGESTEVFSGRQQSYTSSADVASREEFTREAVITVLQGIPYDGPFDPDPVGADAARQLGLDIIRDTFTQLIIIPPLPVEVASQVLEKLARLTYKPAAPKLRDLVDLVGVIKQIIVEEGDRKLQPLEARKVAQGVLVFI